ncbi:MAG: DUF309 domain-containing protein [Candidatus Marinimicrobia bacterium]|jgi:hypothetical protein|nr:DUF309 domain-containing protein [Candidatus Neomarinimicrobiota bacterium]
MEFTEKHIKNIFSGIEAFNSCKYDRAHECWEKVWKDLRDDDRRIILKPFIQLSGAYLNCLQKKNEAAIYLIEKSKTNILKYQSALDQIILSDALISDIDLLLRKKLTVKVFNQLQIKKAG